jgi:hypothetical protein
MFRYQFIWKDDHGNTVLVTYCRATDSSSALGIARRQVFARRHNPYHLTFVVRELGEKKQTVKKSRRKKVDISCEVDMQEDFWYNKM